MKWRQEPLPMAAPGRPVTEPCGTYAAYRRHERHGEPIDAACDRAYRARKAEWNGNRKRKARRAAA